MDEKFGGSATTKLYVKKKDQPFLIRFSYSRVKLLRSDRRNHELKTTDLEASQQSVMEYLQVSSCDWICDFYDFDSGLLVQEVICARPRKFNKHI